LIASLVSLSKVCRIVRQVDAFAFGQGHHQPFSSLPAAPSWPSSPFALAFVDQGVHRQHTHLERRLHGLANLNLVGVQRDFERILRLDPGLASLAFSVSSAAPEFHTDACSCVILLDLLEDLGRDDDPVVGQQVVDLRFSILSGVTHCRLRTDSSTFSS
jgi:hypothetical protein